MTNLSKKRWPKAPGVYIIKNTINSDVYVGAATNVNMRIKKHHYHLRANKHHNKNIQAFVNQYGVDVLLFEVLELCDLSLITEREQYYIDTVHPTFNISPTARTTKGLFHSEETKQKIKQILTGKRYGPRSEETKRKQSIAQKGRTFTEEHKRRISEGKKGNRVGIPLSDAHRNAIRIGRLYGSQKRKTA